MDRIRIHVSHTLGGEPGDARARLEALMARIAARFPGYQLRHDWLPGERPGVRFRFEKAGRGEGGGSVEVTGESVLVDLDAHYNLPFFVPIAVAEKVVRDEVGRILRDIFG